MTLANKTLAVLVGTDTKESEADQTNYRRRD
jgi:hypothetical protein